MGEQMATLIASVSSATEGGSPDYDKRYLKDLTLMFDQMLAEFQNGWNASDTRISKVLDDWLDTVVDAAVRETDSSNLDDLPYLVETQMSLATSALIPGNSSN